LKNWSRSFSSMTCRKCLNNKHWSHFHTFPYISQNLELIQGDWNEFRNLQDLFEQLSSAMAAARAIFEPKPCSRASSSSRHSPRNRHNLKPDVRQMPQHKVIHCYIIVAKTLLLQMFFYNMFIYVCIYTYVYTYIYVYIYIYCNMYIYMYIYISSQTSQMLLEKPRYGRSTQGRGRNANEHPELTLAVHYAWSREPHVGQSQGLSSCYKRYIDIDLDIRY
jgi:hypothetical protein